MLSGDINSSPMPIFYTFLIIVYKEAVKEFYYSLAGGKLKETRMF